MTKFSQRFLSLISAISSRGKRQVKISLIALNPKQSVVAASIIMTALVWGVKQIGWLQFLELVSYDYMVRLQPEKAEDSRLLVVEITEEDIFQENQWPISDRTLAQALQKLQQLQPKVIGLDLYRNIPQPPGREELLKQLEADNIVGIYYIGDTAVGGVSPIPGMAVDKLGFNDIVIDDDNVVRRNFLFGYEGEKKHYSFSLRLALKYLEKKDISLKVTSDALHFGNTVFPRLDARAGGYQNLDNAGRQIMISYRSEQRIARMVSLGEVLNGKVDPKWVKDKVVLIGATAPSANDFFLTPYNASQSANHSMSGVVLHAQLVSQLLSTILDRKPLIWFWYEWIEILWVWSWAFIGGWLAWRQRHPFLQILVTIIFLGILFTCCFGFFIQAGWIPFIPPAIAFLATNITILAYRAVYNNYYDPLTGLPNRQLFLQHLEWAITDVKNQNPLFAVLFLDIDSFKLINESFSHYFGDKFLTDFTHRLKASLGGKGILARLGGDEFAILIENVAESNQAIQLADFLQQEMSLPFKINQQEIFTSLSVGIAFNQQQLKHQPADLLRDAHTAMYRAKDLGKSRHEVFATGMHTHSKNRLQLEAELRRAIDKEEFYLNYQPIICLKTNQIAGFEALVRWNHPQRGFVSPVEFIPVAEETGLIIPLGEWILESAFHQLSVWQTQFPSNPPLMMSINLSGNQLAQENLVEVIQQLLNATGINPQTIKLEITESVAMQDVEAAISILLHLRSLNLQLSIDDFGTGYSSLSYLHRFPINTLKIDRSFVSRMTDADEDAAIVKTIIMLSDNLGMDVVAEGIETKSQQLKLLGLGAEYGQGYLFSKPLDSDNASKFLNIAKGEIGNRE
ncbi:EAL domain-containing protein [Calothrix sp. CCY 0018]|uniref:EAL domain-containing protein n=1 Tax=Calothrix sp. CCY 0018 TaxID=3103864 RepID=UPI0039C64329